MSDQAWTTIGLIAVALIGLWNTYYTRKVEKNTNSMKDALVASTARASHAEGEASGIAKERANPQGPIQ